MTIDVQQDFSTVQELAAHAAANNRSGPEYEAFLARIQEGNTLSFQQGTNVFGPFSRYVCRHSNGMSIYQFGS